MIKLRNIIIVLLILLIIPNIYSSSISVNISTTPDNRNNVFYITQSTARAITFDVYSNYLPLEQFKESKVEYTLETSSEKPMQNISMSLSKNTEYFRSKVDTQVTLNIRPNNFNNNLIKVIVNAKLYDEYNNLIASNSKLITLVSNNSKEFYPSTYNKTEPKFNGYDYSRSTSILLNKYDKDTIKIKEYIRYGFTYNLKCTASNNGIITKTKYLGNNNFDLNLSIDNNKTINAGNYIVKCNAYNRNNNYNLKPITVQYFDQNINEPITLKPNKDMNTSNDMNISDSNASNNINNKKTIFRTIIDGINKLFNN